MTLSRVLWFGDERGYNATDHAIYCKTIELWFGDERGYNATLGMIIAFWVGLWFGDERGYNATPRREPADPLSCGLVMKEDITQPMHLP